MLRMAGMRSLMAGALVMAGVFAGASTALAQVTYVRGNDANPETLDQHKTSTVAEANILRDLY